MLHFLTIFKNFFIAHMICSDSERNTENPRKMTEH